MKFLLSASVLVLSFSAFSSAYAQNEQMPVAEESHEVISGSVSEPVASRQEIPDVEEVPGELKEKEKPVDPLDPISGTVPLSETPFYDFYERQIRYKKADKEFRSSIEARRVSFEQPNSDHLNTAKSKIDAIYKKENEEALKAQQNKVAQGENKVANVPPAPVPAIPPQPKDNRPIVPVGEPSEGINKIPQTMNEQEDAVEQASVAQPSVPPAAAPKEVPDVKVQTSAQAPVPPATTPVEEKKVGVKEIGIEETPQVGAPSKKIVVPEDAPDFEKSPIP